ncbi:MAGUK p55 subfamily member 7 [Chelonia mydas]|uniref:MAGUK p55 subfamily member 7 n=1 Tax=Chelonia mydas TaxID=8469 RepID=M7BU04_CHEMY|nr:MAGUK p55 subfamily member 7 [Chelonia mydas]
MQPYSSCKVSLYELLAALPAQLQPHVDSQEDLTFLWDMFGEKSLHSLVKYYSDISTVEKELRGLWDVRAQAESNETAAESVSPDQALLPKIFDQRRLDALSPGMEHPQEHTSRRTSVTARSYLFPFQSKKERQVYGEPPPPPHAASPLPPRTPEPSPLPPDTTPANQPPEDAMEGWTLDQGKRGKRKVRALLHPFDAEAPQKTRKGGTDTEPSAMPTGEIHPPVSGGEDKIALEAPIGQELRPVGAAGAVPMDRAAQRAPWSHLRIGAGDGTCRCFQELLAIHEKLHYYEKQSPVPILHGAAALADDLAEELQSKPLNTEIGELLKLLSKPNIKAMLSVHDTVAQKNYDPVLPPIPDDIDEEEDSVKIIRLVKNREPLGATIKRDEHTGAIVVARIMRGGAADRSGLIHIGDELREVNGIPVDDKKPEEIIQILEICIEKTRNTYAATENFQQKIISPFPQIKCSRGCLLLAATSSILKIYMEEVVILSNSSFAFVAGLLTILLYFLAFVLYAFTLRPEDAECAGYNSGPYIAGFRRSFRLSRKDRKTNKSMYECKKSDQYDTADVPTYEEVAPYRRQPNEKYRLVVLVGPVGVGLNELKRKLLISDTQHYGVTVPRPVGVGLNELKRKLLISDTQHYGVTVPHTTRARRGQESDGVEYIFISKHLFETDVQNNKFIEYGEYKNNYYGTSIDSVRSVLTKNKVCLLDVQPHEEDFQEMIKSAQMMESQYGHLFDKVIVNDDLTTAYNELKTTFDKLETETFWVPVSWLHS